VTSGENYQGEEKIMEKTTAIAERYFEKPRWLKTGSGLPVKEVYTPEDIKDRDYARDIGEPGKFPFTRGIFPDMYRGRLWSLREICGYDSPRATNKRLKYLLDEGESALNVIFDQPTQNFIDSDHPLAKGDLGIEGVPICSLRDMEILLEGIPIDQVSLTMSTESPVVYFMYLGAAEKQGVPLSKVRATILNDPVGHICARNFLGAYPLDLALRLCVDTIVFSSRNVPRAYTLSAGAAALRESGATAAQEIALDFCAAQAYLKEAVKRGANIDEIAPRVTFTHRVGIDIFEEAAKFRAARKVWAKLMRDEFGAKDPRSLTYKVHVVTKGSDLVPQQPENNIIRIAYQALAAVLGGVQSMHTTSFDEPICLPTEESVRLAIRTQQILCYETGVANVVDPLGGSYYVEYLTAELEQEMTRIIEEHKEAILEFAGSGRLFRMLQEQAYRFQREVESGERIVVGLNKFVVPEEKERELKLHQVDEEAVEEHLANLRELRRTRDARKVKECLENLRQVAGRKEENLCPAILEAVRAYATLGEIMGAIRLGYDYSYDPFGVLDYPFKQER
jgi:methylmalonyl-CoA mutase N-terminal domain/subunit